LHICFGTAALPGLAITSGAAAEAMMDHHDAATL